MADEDVNLPEALRDARTVKRFLLPLMEADRIIEASLYASRQVLLEQTTLVNLQTEQAAAHAAITQLGVDYEAATQHAAEATAALAADLEAARRAHDDATMAQNVQLDNLVRFVQETRTDADEAMAQAKALAASEIAATELKTSERLAELAAQTQAAEDKLAALNADIDALKAKHL